MKPRTTLKLTSASRSATRTSRRASWMLSSLSRPWPPRRSKIVVSLALSESSMECPSLRNYAEHFNSRTSRVGGGAEFPDDLGGVLGLHSGRAGHENRGAVFGQRSSVLHLHPTVDRHVHGAGAQHGSHLSNLRIHRGNELLTPEAGVDRHDKNEVEIVLDPLDHVRGRCGI